MDQGYTSARLRGLRRIGTVGAAFLLFVVPFAAVPSASAYPGYQDSIT